MGSTVTTTSGGIQGLTLSRSQIAEPALADYVQQLADDGQQWVDDGPQPADDSMASDDGEHEDNDGPSEVSEEAETGENDENDENVVELGADDEYLSAHWVAQRPIGNEFLCSTPSILTITPGHTQASSRWISYTEWRTPTPILASQNCDTPAILCRLPAAVNSFATRVRT